MRANARTLLVKRISNAMIRSYGGELSFYHIDNVGKNFIFHLHGNRFQRSFRDNNMQQTVQQMAWNPVDLRSFGKQKQFAFT